jgi:hypothetical protein
MLTGAPPERRAKRGRFVPFRLRLWGTGGSDEAGILYCDYCQMRIVIGEKRHSNVGRKRHGIKSTETALARSHTPLLAD